jgi:hypothetical protein
VPGRTVRVRDGGAVVGKRRRRYPWLIFINFIVETTDYTEYTERGGAGARAPASLVGRAADCSGPPAGPGGGDARAGFGYSRGVVVNHWLGSVSKDSTSR